jgi:hypothetical protein
VSVPAGVAVETPASGVALAVHDFTGDATCLADLPLTAVRLATHLTRRATEPIVGQALRNLVDLAHQAGALVVVDDLRTEAEAEWWRAPTPTSPPGRCTRYRRSGKTTSAGDAHALKCIPAMPVYLRRAISLLSGIR